MLALACGERRCVRATARVVISDNRDTTRAVAHVNQRPCGADFCSPDSVLRDRVSTQASTVTDSTHAFETSVRRSVVHWNHDPHNLLQVLREVQEANGYVAPAAIAMIARLLRLSY